MSDFKNTVFNITKITDILYGITSEEFYKPRYIIRETHTLIFKFSGITEYRIGDDIFELSLGELIYIPKGCSYVVYPIEFGNSFAVNFETADELSLSPFVIPFSNCDTVKKTLRNMMKSTDKQESSIVNHNLGLLYGFIAKAQQKIKDMLFSESTVDYCNKAYKYIQENWCKKELSSSEIAGAVGISESRLRELFDRFYEASPKELVTKIRLRKAKQLLINSKSSVQKVSDYIGFSNVSYFSRFFKEQTGYSPSEYQDKHKF